jgi:hypothetical protein
MSLLVGANLALWLCNQVLGFTIKDHGGLFILIYLIDFFTFLAFALLGILTGWLLAFRPEALKRSIERSIAKRNSN